MDENEGHYFSDKKGLKILGKKIWKIEIILCIYKEVCFTTD